MYESLLEIQEIFFNPKIDPLDHYAIISKFLSAKESYSQKIILFFIKEVFEGSPLKQYSLSGLLQKLKQDKLIDPGYKPMYENYFQNALKLDKESYLKSVTKVFPMTLFKIVYDDNLEKFIDFLDNCDSIPGITISILAVSLRDFCVLLRAFKCLEYLLKEEYQFDDRCIEYAGINFTEEEFKKYFRIPVKSDVSYHYFIYRGISHNIWMLDDVLLSDVEVWKSINAHNVILPREMIKIDFYAPSIIAPMIRKEYYDPNANTAIYNELTDAYDQLYDLGEYDISNLLASGEPDIHDILFLAIAKASHSRPHSFHNLVEYASELILSNDLKPTIYSQVVIKYPFFIGGLLAKGVKINGQIVGDPAIFGEFVPRDQYIQFCLLPYLRSFAPYAYHYSPNNLRHDEWRVARLLRDPTYSFGYNYTLFNDDLEELLEILEGKRLHQLFRLENEKISLMDRCAMFGSFRCYSYLKINGDSTENPIKFAIWGGDMRIITQALDEYLSPQATEVAVLPSLFFRRIQVLEYLIDSDLVQDDVLGSIVIPMEAAIPFDLFKIFIKKYMYQYNIPISVSSLMSDSKALIALIDQYVLDNKELM